MSGASGIYHCFMYLQNWIPDSVDTILFFPVLLTSVLETRSNEISRSASLFLISMRLLIVNHPISSPLRSVFDEVHPTAPVHDETPKLKKCLPTVSKRMPIPIYLAMRNNFSSTSDDFREVSLCTNKESGTFKANQHIAKLRIRTAGPVLLNLVVSCQCRSIHCFFV